MTPREKKLNRQGSSRNFERNDIGPVTPAKTQGVGIQQLLSSLDGLEVADIGNEEEGYAPIVAQLYTFIMDKHSGLFELRDFYFEKEERHEKVLTLLKALVQTSLQASSDSSSSDKVPLQQVCWEELKKDTTVMINGNTLGVLGPVAMEFYQTLFEGSNVNVVIQRN